MRDVLANLSGGRTVYVSKNASVSAALEQIRLELSRQYNLGYYVSHRPGVHRIRVEVPGKDLKVRANAKYQ